MQQHDKIWAVIKTLDSEKSTTLRELVEYTMEKSLTVEQKISMLAWEIHDHQLVELGAYEIASELVMRPIWAGDQGRRLLQTLNSQQAA